MTIRRPDSLKEKELSNCSKWNNKILITSAENYKSEYADNPYKILIDMGHDLLPLVIQHVLNMYNIPATKWNKQPEDFKLGEINPVELIVAKYPEEGFEKCNGKNPFAWIDNNHGCKKFGIGDGKRYWESIPSISKIINNNTGDIQFCFIFGCESKEIGNQLQSQTHKIEIMHAIHSDHPSNGLQFFDGVDDSERFNSKSMKAIEMWKNEFILLQSYLTSKEMLQRYSR